jgi:type IV secretory pathway TrbL component
MGLMRKVMSVSTMGAVDFRSDKERTAAYTKAAKKEAKEQTRLMREQAAHLRTMRQAEQAQQQAAPTSSPAPQMPPAGWYPDQADASLVRWFDGTQWTDVTQPRDPES